MVPLDRQTIVASVKKTHRLVVVDEAYLNCGIQSELMAIVAEEAFSYLEAAPKRLGNPNVPVPFPPTCEEWVIPGKEAIACAIREVAGKRKSRP